MNFTGSDSNTVFAGATTVYDSNPKDGLPTLFSGNFSMYADILIDPFNNSKGAWLLTLFNEGAGLNGLALYLWNAGNSDSYAINLVSQTGVTCVVPLSSRSALLLRAPFLVALVSEPIRTSHPSGSRPVADRC